MKKPGVIQSILSVIKKKGPIDKPGIHKELIKLFPDRDPQGMLKTIGCQVGGKNRPLRMEKERKVKFLIKDNKFSLKK